MKSHTFCFNPRSNGGEQVTLTTKFIDHGKGDWSIEQKLEMMSYCNAASFTLVGAGLTPDNLRDLANQLDEFINKNKVGEE